MVATITRRWCWRKGLSIIANRDVNDPRDERVKLAQRLLTLQTLDSPVKFPGGGEQGFCPSGFGTRSPEYGDPRR